MIYISVLLQVDLEGVHVLLESEGGHGPEQIVPVDSLALLLLALVARPASPQRKSQTETPKQNRGRGRGREIGRASCRERVYVLV